MAGVHVPIPAVPAEAGIPELSHSAFQRLRSAIFDGSLYPGEYLDYSALEVWLGLAPDHLRNVVRDLARIGLVEAHNIEKPRITLPNLTERDEIIQCLGALLGGVARVTIPSMKPVDREALLVHLDQLGASVHAEDPYTWAAHNWEMIETLVHACPNPYLAQATRGRIEALAFLISLTHTEEQLDWVRLQESYAAFHAATLEEDGIGAELAIERAFRITTTGQKPDARLTEWGAETPSDSDEARLAQMIGALLGGVVRLTVPTVNDADLETIVNAAECAQEAARERDAVQHREWAISLVHVLLGACPNRHLVNAVKNTIDSLGLRISTIWVQQHSRWELVEEAYAVFVPAVQARDAVSAELAFERACLM